MAYQRVCVAGTFDHIHAGHEALLGKAFEVGSRVLIGLTSDAYVSSYKTRSVRAYTARYDDLIIWLRKTGYDGRYTITPIDDPFKPAVSDPTLEALIVSHESIVRAKKLNKKRVESGLTRLTLVVIPSVNAEDTKPISSTRVRARQIDRSGRLLMPETMRDELSVPLGRIVTEPKQCDVVVSVGDMTTTVLLEKDIVPNLIIIDNKVNRQTYSLLKSTLVLLKFPTVHTVSGPGFIAKEAIDKIQKAFRETHMILEVFGEEDLLVLPVIEHAPLGSVVYYGQPARHPCGQALAGGPEVGLVEVIVTKEKKKQAIALLTKFSVQ